MIAPNEYEPNRINGIIGGIDIFDAANVIILDKLKNIAIAIAKIDWYP